MQKNKVTKAVVCEIIVLLIASGVVSAFYGNQPISPRQINRDNWLYVGGNGPGNYSTIQSAIDAASSGDTVFVFNGIYEEQINVDKSLNIEGESNTNTYIDGGFNVSSDTVIIQNFNITNGYKIDPLQYNHHYYGLYVISSNNGFYHNIFWNIIGENWDLGDGGNAAGIYLNSSNNNNISLNSFSYIHGGDGGAYGTSGQGTNGGIGSGLYLLNCDNNNILQNTVDHIQGGSGGGGDVSAGDGGIGAGIYLTSSESNTIVFTDIKYINGGWGASIVFPGAPDGGDGGIGAGLFFDSSSSNNVITYSISSVKGGYGGSSGGISSGNGGTGSTGAGCYLKSSFDNTLTLRELSDIKGGNGGDGEDVGGGQAGIAAGAYSKESASNLITIVEAYDIVGGTGGHGFWSGGNGNIGTACFMGLSNNNKIAIENVMNITGGEGGISENEGGSGSIGSAIYLQSSNNNDIIVNNASAIKGGNGGIDGGFGGNGGTGAGSLVKDSTNNVISSSSFFNVSGGIGVDGGYNGTGYGIYLENASSNLIYHNNLINNELNAYDTNNNFWYNTTLQEGNYWSDYTGSDNNGDGIGDTPYNIPGGNNQDIYPFMQPNGWMVPPSPPVIEGPTRGIINSEYIFCINATDPNGDNLYCMWDWDDGNITSWIGPYSSGEPIFASHNWSQKGTYEIHVKLKDIHGQESGWSDPHIITIYELKKTIMFGKYTNMTTENGFITIEAVSLWTIQVKTFQFVLHLPPEKIMFSDDYVGIKMERFIAGVFDVAE